MSLVRRVLGLGYPLCPWVMFLVTLSLGGKGILYLVSLFDLPLKGETQQKSSSER